ncbi:MAG: thioredoxin family protein, partial [Chitinophagaceae bacterium]|nr:thioredoxin family protein [Chitinophagaceae bacterium]
LLFDFSNYYNLPSSRETLLDWLSKMQSATTCETNLSSKKTQLLLNSLQYRKGKKIEMDTLFKDLLRDKENKLMIFWNSNCVHCSEMMPDLLNTLEKLKNRNIKLIMISTNDDNESFKKYLETNNKYIVNITSEKGSVLMNKFGILFSPTFFLIKDNTIFSKVETYEKFKKTLEEFKID